MSQTNRIPYSFQADLHFKKRQATPTQPAAAAKASKSSSKAEGKSSKKASANEASSSQSKVCSFPSRNSCSDDSHEFQGNSR